MDPAEGTVRQPFHWHYGSVEDKNFGVNGHKVLVLLFTFSVILLFLILCVYIRWFCRWGREAVTASSAVGGHGQVVGLDKVALETLPVKRRKHVMLENGVEAPSCSICLTEFVEGGKVKVMPDCQHEFHPDCVDQWLGIHPTCPLCRASLGSTANGANVVEEV